MKHIPHGSPMVSMNLLNCFHFTVYILCIHNVGDEDRSKSSLLNWIEFSRLVPYFACNGLLIKLFIKLRSVPITEFAVFCNTVLIEYRETSRFFFSLFHEKLTQWAFVFKSLFLHFVVLRFYFSTKNQHECAFCWFFLIFLLRSSAH